MTSREQCVMTTGTTLMLLWSASNWDMLTLEVSGSTDDCETIYIYINLNYFTAGISHAFFGAGTGPIYLDDVGCTSTASHLLECPSRPILTHDCLHSADAGVVCEGEFFKSTNIS